MTRPRLFTLVVLGLAVVVLSTICEAASKRIHVTAKVVQTTSTGNPASPQLGDLRVTNVDLLDESGMTVGTGGGVCTVVSVPPLDVLEQCLITAVFVEGHIIFGGLAQSPEVGVTGRFGILGGTDGFREARGEATLVVTSAEFQDATFDIDQPRWP